MLGTTMQINSIIPDLSQSIQTLGFKNLTFFEQGKHHVMSNSPSLYFCLVELKKK